MALLTYSDMVAISYVDSDIAVLLTPEQQSLAIQALALFAMPSLWSDWYTQKQNIDELVPATLLALETPVTIPPDSINLEHTHWHINSQNNIGNGLILTIRATQIMNHIATQSPAAQNDEWYSQSFWLKSGISYVMDLYAVKNASSGIVALELRKKSDHSVLASLSQDLYSAVAVDNFKFAIGYITTEDIEVYVRGKMTTKNVSSSGYACNLTCIMVRM